MNAGGSEPTAKRARDVHALSIQCKMNTGHAHEAALRKPQCKMNTGHALEAAGLRKELQSLMASSEVKRILEELEEEADLKLPVDRRRQMPMATSQWSSDCAEIYSPPRITATASRMGLKLEGRMGNGPDDA